MARVAVVTGGTRGIGAAISRMLHKAGYRVVANYASDHARAEKFTAEAGIKALSWDVADFAQCMEAIGRIRAEDGAVDIVVNNAGITRDATMRKMGREHWDKVIDTNLGSCFNMCKAVWD